MNGATIRGIDGGGIRRDQWLLDPNGRPARSFLRLLFFVMKFQLRNEKSTGPMAAIVADQVKRFEYTLLGELPNDPGGEWTGKSLLALPNFDPVLLGGSDRVCR